MALFGRKTPVQLTVEPPRVIAGEEIICCVDVGEIDAKVQGGRVELGYENTVSLVVARLGWSGRLVPAA